MGHRLSFLSSPDSDYDIAASSARDSSDNAVTGHRPARASSDPNIAVMDNISPRPPRPVEPPPAPPRAELHPQLGYDPRYVCIMNIANLLTFLASLCERYQFY